MSRLRRHLSALRRDASGNISIMAAFLMIPLVVVTGGAVDIALHERGRIALQDALDRGVLAAAALKQTEKPEDVIRSYLKNVPYIDTVKLTVNETKTTNLREVSATATVDYATTFAQLIGKKTMGIEASSTAKEARTNLEISMVLDISGSMLDNGGIYQLRPAAKSFLDTIFKDEESKKYTSVSVVPFAGQVNVGQKVYEYLVSKEYSGEKSDYNKVHHVNSWCFEFNDASKDYDAGTPYFYGRDQTPHFSYYNFGLTAKKPWWCPTGPTITYMTNDLATLKAGIDALDPYDGTGTAYGMKWAELLLNPAMQPTLAAIGNKGLAPIPAAFRDRPAAFTDEKTMKFIVLMTDGQIGFQPRPTDKAKSDRYNVDQGNISKSGWANLDITEEKAKGYYKKVCAYTKKEGITIFTIAFKVSDAIAKTIAECASNETYAYKVDGLDMSSAFQSIATTMQKIKLTQ